MTIKIEDLEEFVFNEIYLSSGEVNDVPMPEECGPGNYQSKEFLDWLAYRAFGEAGVLARKNCRIMLYHPTRDKDCVCVLIHGHTKANENYIRNYRESVKKMATRIACALSETGKHDKSVVFAMLQDNRDGCRCFMQSVGRPERTVDVDSNNIGADI